MGEDMKYDKNFFVLVPAELKRILMRKNEEGN